MQLQADQNLVIFLKQTAATTTLIQGMSHDESFCIVIGGTLDTTVQMNVFGSLKNKSRAGTFYSIHISSHFDISKVIQSHTE